MKTKMTESNFSKVSSMLSSGAAQKEAGLAVGVSQGTIRNWLKAGHVSVSRQGKRKAKVAQKKRKRVRHETIEVFPQETHTLTTLTITGDPASLARFMKEIRS